MILNVNIGEAVKFTQKLKELNRSAFPSAVRGALNKAVYDVKTNTMPFKAAEDFVNRSPNFFRANSKFENASGFNVNSMVSKVGFTETNLKGGNNFAVKDLQQQEYGGVIDKRSYVPLEGARGGSMGSLVKPNARLRKIRKIANPINVKAKNPRQAFVKSVYFAGKGGYVLGEHNGNGILWRVNSLNKTEGGQFKLTAMYSFKENRKVRVKGTSFMKEASLKSASKMESYYAEEAQRQINKLEGGHH
jgi:hypothetical protein